MALLALLLLRGVGGLRLLLVPGVLAYLLVRFVLHSALSLVRATLVTAALLIALLIVCILIVDDIVLLADTADRLQAALRIAHR